MLKPQNLVIVGCGTDCGKTIVSAIFTDAWKCHYWKPVHCGDNESDLDRVKSITATTQTIPGVYSFKHHASAHYAAKLEKQRIDETRLSLPKVEGTLIVESSGGLLHPFRHDLLQADVVKKWNSPVVLVSRHYLGSINHTLLTIEVLYNRGIRIAGVVFNGEPYPDAEEVILKHANAPLIGHLFPESDFNPSVLQKYAIAWNLQ